MNLDALIFLFSTSQKEKETKASDLHLRTRSSSSPPFFNYASVRSKTRTKFNPNPNPNYEKCARRNWEGEGRKFFFFFAKPKEIFLSPNVLGKMDRKCGWQWRSKNERETERNFGRLIMPLKRSLSEPVFANESSPPQKWLRCFEN